MAEDGSAVGRWIAGIVGTVIAGVLLALILNWINSDDNDNGGSTGGGGSVATTDPNSDPVLPDVLVGEWGQASWNEAERGGVTLGMVPFDGRLSVSGDGDSEWQVNIDDQFQDDPPNTPAVRCRGRVSVSAAMEDTSVAETINYTGNMESLRDDIGAAFCGDGGNAYSLGWAPEDDPQTLEMRNDFGVFTWQR